MYITRQLFEGMTLEFTWTILEIIKLKYFTITINHILWAYAYTENSIFEIQLLHFCWTP